MNQAMKQRLTGTLVVGCLALIFIPLLLDGEGVQPAPEPVPIPPAPELSEVVFEEPQRPVILADEQTSDPESVPDLPVQSPEETAGTEPEPTELAQAATDEPARLASGLPESWAVRLGVFGESANAEKLLKQLVDADYKAYTRHMDSNGAGRTGVFVGPVLSRVEANRLLGELSDAFQLNGMVVRFEIETLH